MQSKQSCPCSGSSARSGCDTGPRSGACTWSPRCPWCTRCASGRARPPRSAGRTGGTGSLIQPGILSGTQAGQLTRLGASVFMDAVRATPPARIIAFYEWLSFQNSQCCSDRLVPDGMQSQSHSECHCTRTGSRSIPSLGCATTSVGPGNSCGDRAAFEQREQRPAKPSHRRADGTRDSRIG